MAPYKPHHRHFALSVVCALALVFAIASCDSDEESNESNDCAETNTCDASNGNPEDKPDKWASVDTSNYLEFYDFIPKGAFVLKTLQNDQGRFIAKSADDSIIAANIGSWDPDAETYDISSYEVWHEDMYYEVKHTIEGEKENQHDLFYTISLKHPDTSAETPKTVKISIPWGGYGSGSTAGANPTMWVYNFGSFVNSPYKEQAVFEKDDVVAGIPCKKYTYESSWNYEWWIMDNGFCLKRNVTSNGELLKVESFEVVKAELNTPSYDYVTQKYAHFKDQISGAITQPVAQMLKLTEAVYGGEWIAPASFLHWNAGGFDMMINFRASNWEGYPVHQIYVEFPAGTDMSDEVEDYQKRIMQIPGMVQNGTGGCTVDMGCQWKYDNYDYGAQDCSGYWKFEIQTDGEMLGYGTPTTPSKIFIQYIDIVCV